MRSLFAKILIWFLSTATLLLAGAVLVSYINFNSEHQNPETPFPILVRLQMREARHAYENGGKAALAETLKRFRSVLNAEMILADADGHDLLTGEDRSKLVREARDRRHGPLFLPFYRPPFGRQTADGKYWFFILPKQNPVMWFVQPTHLVLYALAVLLCWALARHLSSPVRALQQSVDKFGRGDLSTRAQTRRRDELGALAVTFNQMADRIQTLVTAERRLLMDISHELRSPLARLAVAVELARSGYDQDASLDRIQKEADRLNAMVGELLEITRAEGDPAHRKHENIDLADLIEEIVLDAQLEADAKNVRVQFTPNSRPVVDGDPELLRRAIENVIRNAVRYSPESEPVAVELQTADGHAVTTVCDRGPGVPEESLPLLFEPFYRVETDRDRKSGGVGLGLSIARRSVQVHGGTILASNAGPGLRVEITLPEVPSKITRPAAEVPALAPADRHAT